jgi:ATP-dependent exoDNAse (exonuclease V) beta subunit
MEVKELQKIIDEQVRNVWVAAHDEKGHHYKNTRTGKIVDSVTTQSIIEKPHLVPWAAGLAVKYFIERMDFYDKSKPEDDEQNARLIKDSKLAFRAVRDDAGDIGTMAHDVIERYLNHWIETGIRKEIKAFLDDSLDPRVWAAARAAEELFNQLDIIPVATELLVGSDRLNGAGTLDFIFLNKGKLYIGDWKSSNQVSDQYAIQVAAYTKMFESMTKLKVAGAMIVHLSKDYNKVRLYDIPYLNRAYAVFKHQNAIYNWLHDGRDKLIERKNRVIIK